MNEEILYRAIEMKARSEEIEKQLAFVSEQIAELEAFRDGLGFLDREKRREILAPLGKGVFAGANLADEKLFVEVGAGVIVRKTPKEIEETIKEQLARFTEAKFHLKEQLEIYIGELGKMFEEVERIRGKKE